MKLQFLSAGLPSWAVAIVIVAAAVLVAALLTVFFKTRKNADKREPAAKEDELPVVEENTVPEPATEVKPSAVAEQKPAVEEKNLSEVAEETAEDEKITDDNDEDGEPQKKIVREDGHVRWIIIKYKKSFTAKLIQSADVVKNYYSELKNELLSYRGVKSRMSWKCETFYSGRTTYAKIAIRGKCPCVFFALDTKNITDEKYIVEDLSDVAAYEKTPTLYRIKNDRRLRYAKELIAAVMGEREKTENYEAENWAAKYPYEKIEPLVERGLVKVLTEEDARSGDVFKPRDFVQANEVDALMQDDVATALIEESEELSDRTKTGIINIDTLGKYFENGETVTLEEIKKRIAEVPKRTTYIKVLARGTLDKRLTVIADSFSIEAAKMILLTGGNVVKKRNG